MAELSELVKIFLGFSVAVIFLSAAVLMVVLIVVTIKDYIEDCRE